MLKVIKIIIIVVLVAVAGYFIYSQFQGRAPSEENLEAYKQSILADPVINNPNLNEEEVLKFTQQLKKAQEAAVDLNFDSLQVINDVARLKQLLGDFDGAIKAWEYANIIRPKNSLSFSNLAALYHYDLRQFDEAEENYLISIANDPNDIPTIRNFFELYYYSLKDNVKAEALLLQSIKENPESADLYALAGSFYQETGYSGKAVEYYEKALELNPAKEAVRRELERLKVLIE